VEAALADWQHLVEIFPIRRLDPNDMGDMDKQTWHDPDGELAERYGLSDEGLVLIRPDGYISLRSRTLAAEPLLRYLHAHFSLQHAS
jgi:hypothetical protein